MSLWTFVKIVAALCVMAVMILTGMLAYHVTVEPLGGIFSELIPDPAGIDGQDRDRLLAEMLESAELPDTDPAEKAFQKAHELLALGKIAEAREKLLTIIHVFPNSPSAPVARRIVGEVNLDEILSTTHMDGKQIHTVKRGESPLAIAAQYKTTMDMMIHLNSMMEIPKIQPGDELIVMPLNLRLLIEPAQNSISLWQGGRFITEYPVLHISPNTVTPRRSEIASIIAEIKGRRVLPQSPEYRAAEKILIMEKPALQIRGWDGSGEKPLGGILLKPEDIEEIALLMRVGNEVEVR